MVQLHTFWHVLCTPSLAKDVVCHILFLDGTGAHRCRRAGTARVREAIYGYEQRNNTEARHSICQETGLLFVFRKLERSDRRWKVKSLFSESALSRNARLYASRWTALR